MQDFSICHFVPYHKDHYSIHTVSFVLETNVKNLTIFPATESVYKLHCVSRGSGLLHTGGKTYPLRAGDLFFTFPAGTYTLEETADFQYMYISFLGARANMIMEKLKISRKNFLFHDFEDVLQTWENGLSVAPAVIDLMSESILLHTFSLLGQRLLDLETGEKKGSTAGAAIKRYVDDHFMEPELSLETISRALNYHKKYVSTVFKETFGVGLSEYLATIRIQNACTLMEDGLTAVGDISSRCGFSDPQYFSRVFKSRMGVPPSGYLKHHRP